MHQIVACRRGYISSLDATLWYHDPGLLLKDGLAENFLVGIL